MGCCASTNKTSAKKKAEAVANPYFKAAAAAAAAGNRRDLPLPPLEEETVKEVLSETPKPKPSSRNAKSQEIRQPSFLKIETDNPPSPPTPPSSSFPIKLEEAKDMEKRTTTLHPDPAVEEISEVSDMCSFSESQLSTTTIGEGRIDDGEVRQRVDRSPAKLPRKRPVSGEFTVRKSSAARRFDQSPGKRNDNNAIKTSQFHHHQSTRDMGRGGNSYTNRRLITGSGGGVRRDPGEGSGRRSRSPATRPALGRSPSSKALRSPGRIPALGHENERKPEETRGDVDKGNWDLPTNESLENPLVSLECFIFL